ncbi:hypothetical protein [Cupriavidus nantongensis]|uniref:hypothetical protein n=1 Tax=Cupriavidus nantongensis TaxID=1796606 RepID=UPI000A59B851|nr:hypothetical protein [Cupriavidus nantongensis]
MNAISTSASRHQPGQRSPQAQSTPRRFGGPGWPPVRRTQIRGEWRVTKDMIWPAVVWNDGYCWAYFHDLTPDTLQWVMDMLREAEFDRHPPGIVRWGGE